jgi:3-phenylpropionate/trans-cinnamate dioxygenase ferredoxin subunit
MMEERICGVADVESGQARRFTLGSLDIAVVRIDDDWYAVGDTCTHQRISLSEGEVDEVGRQIECWKHGSCFSLETGEPSSLPATKAVPVYELRIDGPDVMVVVP